MDGYIKKQEYFGLLLEQEFKRRNENNTSDKEIENFQKDKRTLLRCLHLIF